MEIIHATRLDGRNIESMNKQGKTAPEQAQARYFKPERFVEAFQHMLDGTPAPNSGVSRQRGGNGNERNIVKQVGNDVIDLSEEFFETFEEQC